MFPRSCSRACSRLYIRCIGNERLRVRECTSMIPCVKTNRGEEETRKFIDSIPFSFLLPSSSFFFFFLPSSCSSSITYAKMHFTRHRNSRGIALISVSLARLIAISKRTRLRKCMLHRFPHFRSLFTRLPATGDFLLHAASLDYPSQSCNGRGHI